MNNINYFKNLGSKYITKIKDDLQPKNLNLNAVLIGSSIIILGVVKMGVKLSLDMASTYKTPQTENIIHKTYQQNNQNDYFNSQFNLSNYSFKQLISNMDSSKNK